MDERTDGWTDEMCVHTFSLISHPTARAAAAAATAALCIQGHNFQFRGLPAFPPHPANSNNVWLPGRRSLIFINLTSAVSRTPRPAIAIRLLLS